MKTKRRRWPRILLVMIIAVLALGLGDYLTGRVHQEFQNPYSRLKRVVARRMEIPYTQTVPNAMSHYYYETLQQPGTEIWEVSDDSYSIARASSAIHYDPAPVAPIMFLNPDVELAFLRALPDNHVRLAVIHSLYQPRQLIGDPQATAWNQQQTERERERVRRIIRWVELDRSNDSVPFPQWWRDNAKLFGLQPNGDLLPESLSAANTTAHH